MTTKGYGATGGPANGGQSRNYGGGMSAFGVPLTCATATEIRELVGFTIFAEQVRYLHRQTGAEVREILRSAREAGIAEFEADQLEALVKAIG